MRRLNSLRVPPRERTVEMDHGRGFFAAAAQQRTRWAPCSQSAPPQGVYGAQHTHSSLRHRVAQGVYGAQHTHSSQRPHHAAPPNQAPPRRPLGDRRQVPPRRRGSRRPQRADRAVVPPDRSVHPQCREERVVRAVPAHPPLPPAVLRRRSGRVYVPGRRLVAARGAVVPRANAVNRGLRRHRPGDQGRQARCERLVSCRGRVHGELTGRRSPLRRRAGRNWYTAPVSRPPLRP
jgi:hypothetical protein